LEDLITAGSRSAAELPEVKASDPVVIMYTSGTTGRPKGVVLTHSAILANGRAVFERMEVTGADVVTSIAPLFHAASFCTALPGCLATGATYIGMEAFDPVEMMEVIQSQRVTVHLAVPTTMRAILQSPRRSEFDLTSLRVVACGGADNDPELLRECAREFPIPHVLQAYGLTEASGLMTVSRLDPEQDPRSVGFPVTGYEVRIVSEKSGEVLPPHSSGEIQIRSAHTLREYFRLPAATEETFTEDGWLKTGDLGELTEEGELRMSGGRLKDMIIRGGENISPAEIENVIARHSLVTEVAVFGLPDAQYGEIVAAALICKSRITPDELREFCSERIARFKTPERFYVVERFPLTPSGKIRKVDLRAQALAGELTLLGEGN
jgi:fatty-acyl-CoA synthase